MYVIWEVIFRFYKCPETLKLGKLKIWVLENFLLWLAVLKFKFGTPYFWFTKNALFTLGTGKTFVGVKLIEALLESGCSTPILILSYKNHALDEFLKHLVRNL